QRWRSLLLMIFIAALLAARPAVIRARSARSRQNACALIRLTNACSGGRKRALEVSSPSHPLSDLDGQKDLSGVPRQIDAERVCREMRLGLRRLNGAPAIFMLAAALFINVDTSQGGAGLAACSAQCPMGNDEAVF